MRKTFCDICNQECGDEPHPNVRFTVHEMEFLVILTFSNTGNPLQRKSMDVCNQCLNKKLIEALSSTLPRPEKPATPFQLSADDRLGILASAIKEATDEAYKAACEAENNLTRDQFVDALMQAIKSGDFMRHVRFGASESNPFCFGEQQCVTYIPYWLKQELETKLETANKLLDRVYPVTIGRDFSSESIWKLCDDIKEFKNGVVNEP